MAKKIVSLNKDYIILIVIIILIIVVIYLIYVYNVSQKKMKESFYQFESFNNQNALKYNATNDNASNDNASNNNASNNNASGDNALDNNTLYIYSTIREKVSCKKSHNSINKGEYPENIAIAGIPLFNLKMYDENKGFSESIGLPAPTKMKGKLFDYIMSFLTNEKNIEYYTVDNSKSKTCPITHKPYYYNKNLRDKVGINNNNFIDLMKEFFKVLIACNNNTSVRFIRYYKKNTITYNETERSYEEIEEGDDLDKEIENNNIVVFIENINIIKFLEVTDTDLYHQFEKYSDSLSVHFKEFA